MNRIFTRPTLNLTSNNRFDRPFHVDMERFFEFSFDLAESLLDLELKYAGEQLPSYVPPAVRPEPFIGPELAGEFNFDIDASWM